MFEVLFFVLVDQGWEGSECGEDVVGNREGYLGGGVERRGKGDAEELG